MAKCVKQHSVTISYCTDHIQGNKWIELMGSYLSSFPNEVEGRRLVVEDRGLSGGEVGVSPQLPPLQALRLDALVIRHPAMDNTSK